MATVLYGGAFNPPHDGHERIIRSLAERHESVVVVPSGYRVDKAYASEAYAVTAEIRERIIRAFESGFGDLPNVRFDYDMLEGRLPRTTTVGMDEYYERKFGTPIVHAFGSDVVNDFSRWFDPERVRTRIRKILLIRNGEVPRTEWLERFELLSPEMSHTESWLSSSLIRARLGRGDFTGMAPRVADAIRSELFRSNPVHSKSGSLEQNSAS